MNKWINETKLTLKMMWFDDSTMLITRHYTWTYSLNLIGFPRVLIILHSNYAGTFHCVYYSTYLCLPQKNSTSYYKTITTVMLATSWKIIFFQEYSVCFNVWKAIKKDEGTLIYVASLGSVSARGVQINRTFGHIVSAISPKQECVRAQLWLAVARLQLGW